MQSPLRVPSLVGRWAYKGPEGTSSLAISGDGTWSGTAAVHGGFEGQFEGRWIVDKGYVYWIYLKSSTPMKKVGTRDKDKIVDIGEDFVEFHTIDNQRRKYFRVK
jgi:hypothetical protein